MATYTSLHGALRLYDSTATPYYIQVLFDEGNLTAPLNRARTEETMIHHRGRGNTTYSHYVSGPDTPITDPLELSFSARIANVAADWNRLRDALSNPDLDGTWQVDGDTWVTTKGDGTLTNGAGSTFTDPAFEDTKKYCVNVEILWTRGGVGIGFQYMVVWFPPDQQSVAESEEGVIISLTGLIYGEISSITSFTAGTES